MIKFYADKLCRLFLFMLFILSLSSSVFANEEIDIKSNGNSITDGDNTPSATDNTDYGSSNIGVQVTRDYTIDNTGNQTLTVSAITITGANASDFVLSTFTTPATVNAGASTNFQINFTPSGAGVRTALVTVTNSDANEGTYTFTIQGTGTLINSNASDISNDGAFTYQTNINYINYTASDITSSYPEIYKVRIRDGGSSANDSDALPTTLTSITFSITNSGLLNKIALYDGTTEIQEQTVTGGTVTFSGITLVAADNNSNGINLRVSFNTTVTDNQQFSFAITAATADPSGSTFAAADAGGVSSSTSGSNNKIEVVATKLIWTTYAGVTPPTTGTVNINTAFSATVNAIDNNDNIDLDANNSITLTESGAGNISSATGLTKSLISGAFTWNDLKLDAAGSYTVTASASGLTSDNFPVDVQAPGAVVTSTPSNLTFCPGDDYKTFTLIQITEGANSDFGVANNQTIVLSAPTGFEFDLTSGTVQVGGASGKDFDNTAPTLTFNNNTTITVQYNVTGTSKKDFIKINNLKIRPIAGNTSGVTNAGLFRISGTANINGDGALDKKAHGTVTLTSFSVYLMSSESDNKLCQGSDITFTGVGATTYEYYVDNVSKSTSTTYSTTSLTPGSHAIKVKGTSNGCAIFSSVTNLTVDPKPTGVSFSTTENNYALNDPKVNLSSLGKTNAVAGDAVSPKPGVFSGDGVVNGFFYPNVANTGAHEISYTYTDGNGCSASDVDTFTVYDPYAAINNLKTDYCVNDDSSYVITANNTSGYQTGDLYMERFNPNTNAWEYFNGGLTFVGPASDKYKFKPSAAGVGNYRIWFRIIYNSTYYMWNYKQTNVNGLPSVDITTVFSTFTCQSNTTTTLNGSPSGGVFSSTVPGFVINPSPGVYKADWSVNTTFWPQQRQINYTYTHPITGCSYTTSRSMYVDFKPDAPTLSGSDTLICLGEDPGAIDAAGGNTIRWYNATPISNSTLIASGAKYDPPAVSSTTSYYATQINFGCESDYSVFKITVKNPATVDAGPDQIICENSNVSLNAIKGGTASTITWTSLGNGSFTNPSSLTSNYNPNATDKSSGRVKLVIKTNDPDIPNDACPIAEDSVFITINPLVVMEAGPDQVVCAGTDINLSGSSTKSSVSFPATWTYNGNSLQFTAGNQLATSFIPTAAQLTNGGSFKMKLTSDDPDGTGPCPVSSDSLVVTINKAAKVDPGVYTSFCETGTKVLDAKMLGSTTAITWSTTGDGNFSNVNNINAIFTPGTNDRDKGFALLRIITNDPDAAGPCPAVKDSVTLIIDSVAVSKAGNDTIYCAGQDIFLKGSVSGSATSGTWSGGVGSFSPDNSSLTARYLPSKGELDNGAIIPFTLTTNDPPGQCASVNDQVIIKINQAPKVDAGNNITVCSGDTIKLNATIGGSTNTITWTGGNNVFNPGATQLKTIYVPSNKELTEGAPYITIKITTDDPDGTGPAGPCSAVSDSLILTINPLPGISFTGLDTSYCDVPNLADVLNGLPAGGKFTGNGIVGALFYPNFAGTGTHKINFAFTDNKGCFKDTNVFTKVFPLPEPDFSISSFCEGDKISFNDNSTVDAPSSVTKWKWDFDNKIDTTQNIIRTLKAGSQTIKFTAYTNHLCSKEIQVPITIGPYPEAKFFHKKICKSDTTTFLDQSRILPIVQTYIKTWAWDFGDGYVLAADSGNIPANTHGGKTFGTFKNPYHIYSDTGYHQAKLIVTSDRGCDSSHIRQVSILPMIKPQNGIGFTESFETGQGGFFPERDSTVKIMSWELGKPNKPGIYGAASGSNAWVTRLDSNHYNNENSWVNCPCFDLSGMEKPMVSFNYKNNSESKYDGAVLQYSFDGLKWDNVGTVGEGLNWVNQSNVASKPGNQTFFFNAWSGVDTSYWKSARHTLDFLGKPTSVRFRVAFASSSSNSEGGFAFDDFKITERSKIVLLEQFTNSSASSNVIVEDNYVNNVTAKRSKDLVAVHYHTSFPGSEPFNNYNNADPGARALFYGITSVPVSVLDGNFYKGNSLGWDSLKVDYRALQDPKFAIELTTDKKTNAMDITAKVTSREQITSNIAVHFVVIERNVTKVTGANGQTKFQWVLKRMLPDAAGTVFNTTWKPGDSQTISKTWGYNMTEVYDTAQLGVIVFVQDNTTKEVYQAIYKLGSGSAITPVIDPNGTFDMNQVVVYPNPSNAEAYIIYNREVDKEMSVKVLDQLGQVVYETMITKGSEGAVVNTENLKSGMYHISITDETGNTVQKKLMVLH